MTQATARVSRTTGPTRARKRLLPRGRSLQGTIEARAGLAWALLFFNILSYDKTASVLPLPNGVGKAITQAVLPVAVFVVLSINRKIVIRPSVFMCLLSLLALEGVFTILEWTYGLGTVLRTFRLVLFVVVLWLLTPYWGQDRMILVRTHLRVLFGFVCLAVVGLFISPGKALNSGRFQGIIWPSPSTQLAHYAAVTIGIVVILWLAHLMRGRSAAIMAVVSLGVLLLTHTRTALLAGVVALAVAVLCWVPESARVRRIAGWTAAVLVVGYLAFASVISDFLQRGQSSQQLTSLTGRTGFWGPLLANPRDKFEMIFGFGISNGTFNGLPIDDNWLDSYQDQGLFGVVVCAVILLFLLVAVFFQARSVYKALALFFIVYAVAASFTEDGITNASAYMLDVTVAASLLVPSSVITLRGRTARKRPAGITPAPPGPGPAAEPASSTDPGPSTEAAEPATVPSAVSSGAPGGSGGDSTD